MSLVKSLSILSLLLATQLQANTLLVSGRVQAADSQGFYSPKTQGWRVQVKWLMDEGEIAQPGDIVAVYDGASIESQIEQEENSLINAREQLERLKGDGELELMEAQFELKKAELSLQKARLDTSVPPENYSTYDYKKYQLELEKSLVRLQKAKEQLEKTQHNQKLELEKQQLTIEHHENELAYQQQLLAKMSQKAQRKGPVIYANHPWNGEKVYIGLTAQPGWKIAEIPSLQGLYIESWIHEADQHKIELDAAATLTFDAYPHNQYPAKLTQLSSQPEKRKEWGQGVYYRAVFEFEFNDDIALLPGMSVQLEVERQDV